MTLYQLKCPGCGAVLDVDETTIDVMFCKYCGSKILLDGQSDTAVKAKANIIMQKEDLQHQQRIAELEEESERMKKQSDNKTIVAAFIITFIFLFAILLLFFIKAF